MQPHKPEEYGQVDEIPWVDFPEDSEFYMTFLGPLHFIQEDGAPIAVVSWEQVQGAWDAATL